MQIIQPNSIKDYLTEVGRGNVAGATRRAFGGYTSVLPVDTEELIWNQGGVRTELTAETTIYGSSTDNGDNATLRGVGLDENHNEIFATATLNGQSQSPFSSDFFRFLIFDAIGPNQSNGTIYAAQQDGSISGGVPAQNKIQAKANAGKRQSWTAVDTVPAGVTMRFIDFKATTTKAKNVSVSFITKEPSDTGFGGPPPFDVYENYHFLPWQMTFPVSEKTDIKFIAESEDVDSKVLILAEAILYDN